MKYRRLGLTYGCYILFFLKFPSFVFDWYDLFTYELKVWIEYLYICQKDFREQELVLKSVQNMLQSRPIHWPTFGTFISYTLHGTLPSILHV